MIGKLLGGVVRIINAPAETIERLANDGKKPKDDERILSGPGEALAKTLDDVDTQPEDR